MAMKHCFFTDERSMKMTTKTTYSFVVILLRKFDSAYEGIYWEHFHYFSFIGTFSLF